MPNDIDLQKRTPDGDGRSDLPPAEQITTGTDATGPDPASLLRTQTFFATIPTTVPEPPKVKTPIRTDANPKLANSLPALARVRLIADGAGTALGEAADSIVEHPEQLGAGLAAGALSIGATSTGSAMLYAGAPWLVAAYAAGAPITVPITLVGGGVVLLSAGGYGMWHMFAKPFGQIGLDLAQGTMRQGGDTTTEQGVGAWQLGYGAGKTAEQILFLKGAKALHGGKGKKATTEKTDRTPPNPAAGDLPTSAELPVTAAGTPVPISRVRQIIESSGIQLKPEAPAAAPKTTPSPQAPSTPTSTAAEPITVQTLTRGNGNTTTPPTTATTADAKTVTTEGGPNGLPGATRAAPREVYHYADGSVEYGPPAEMTPVGDPLPPPAAVAAAAGGGTGGPSSGGGPTGGGPSSGGSSTAGPAQPPQAGGNAAQTPASGQGGSRIPNWLFPTTRIRIHNTLVSWSDSWDRTRANWINTKEWLKDRQNLPAGDQKPWFSPDGVVRNLPSWLAEKIAPKDWYKKPEIPRRLPEWFQRTGEEMAAPNGEALARARLTRVEKAAHGKTQRAIQDQPATDRAPARTANPIAKGEIVGVIPNKDLPLAELPAYGEVVKVKKQPISETKAEDAVVVDLYYPDGRGGYWKRRHPSILVKNLYRLRDFRLENTPEEMHVPGGVDPIQYGRAMDGGIAAMRGRIRGEQPAIGAGETVVVHRSRPDITMHNPGRVVRVGTDGHGKLEADVQVRRPDGSFEEVPVYLEDLVPLNDLQARLRAAANDPHPAPSGRPAQDWARAVNAAASRTRRALDRGEAPLRARDESTGFEGDVVVGDTVPPDRGGRLVGIQGEGTNQEGWVAPINPDGSLGAPQRFRLSGLARREDVLRELAPRHPNGVDRTLWEDAFNSARRRVGTGLGGYHEPLRVGDQVLHFNHPDIPPETGGTVVGITGQGTATRVTVEVTTSGGSRRRVTVDGTELARQRDFEYHFNRGMHTDTPPTGVSPQSWNGSFRALNTDVQMSLRDGLIPFGSGDRVYTQGLSPEHGGRVTRVQGEGPSAEAWVVPLAETGPSGATGRWIPVRDLVGFDDLHTALTLGEGPTGLNPHTWTNIFQNAAGRLRARVSRGQLPCEVGDRVVHRNNPDIGFDNNGVVIGHTRRGREVFVNVETTAAGGTRRWHEVRHQDLALREDIDYRLLREAPQFDTPPGFQPAAWSRGVRTSARRRAEARQNDGDAGFNVGESNGDAVWAPGLDPERGGRLVSVEGIELEAGRNAEAWVRPIEADGSLGAPRRLPLRDLAHLGEARAIALGAPAEPHFRPALWQRSVSRARGEVRALLEAGKEPFADGDVVVGAEIPAGVEAKVVSRQGSGIDAVAEVEFTPAGETTPRRVKLKQQDLAHSADAHDSYFQGSPENWARENPVTVEGGSATAVREGCMRHEAVRRAMGEFQKGDIRDQLGKQVAHPDLGDDFGVLVELDGYNAKVMMPGEAQPRTVSRGELYDPETYAETLNQKLEKVLEKGSKSSLEVGQQVRTRAGTGEVQFILGRRIFVEIDTPTGPQLLSLTERQILPLERPIPPESGKAGELPPRDTGSDVGGRRGVPNSIKGWHQVAQAEGRVLRVIHSSKGPGNVAQVRGKKVLVEFDDPALTTRKQWIPEDQLQLETSLADSGAAGKGRAEGVPPADTGEVLKPEKKAASSPPAPPEEPPPPPVEPSPKGSMFVKPEGVFFTAADGSSWSIGDMTHLGRGRGGSHRMATVEGFDPKTNQVLLRDLGGTESVTGVDVLRKPSAEATRWYQQYLRDLES